MAQLQVSGLTFSYEGSGDNVFEDVSFSIDTSWKLGLIGRNGKGKTTLLNLFMGKYEYSGSISCGTVFDCFPYAVSASDLDKTAAELVNIWKPQVEKWQILVQLSQIGMDPECMYRSFGTLSYGERTRVMLAVLFASDDEMLLIDEPTNHLDKDARKSVKEYLKTKKGFILVSHDRDLLDAVTDHVLVLNRNSVEVQAGNFSSWQENKERADAFARTENEKHIKEIGKLKAAADRSDRWAVKNENTKIGFDPLKEPERNISTRSYIGAKTKKMQARVKSYEKRMDREIAKKEGLLKDIEQITDLKIGPLKYHKDTLIEAKDLALSYDHGAPLFTDLTFHIRQDERVFLSGRNGCGKTSLIKAILQEASEDQGKVKYSGINVTGELRVASGLKISYINQDTSFLRGTLKEYADAAGLNESLFLAVLRQLDLEREHFGKDMSDFSEGQKKKVLIAASLITPAHLYIWDEPLNYIDVFSRMQIEKLILQYKPTMLLVEHDVRFREKIGTRELTW
ncbi:MAG: ABC-F type ribosomal protection protein [Lachnospiraceae bacterium]|nr:ABC-F type ribosomal protection protein [Lachnospiraceae bacterium]